MTKLTHDLNNVFGLTRNVPDTYIAREVDNKLEEALYGGKHVVIRGDSKQGKTCLRKVSIDDDDSIVVSCQKSWTLEDLYKNILIKSGAKIVEIEMSDESSSEVSPKLGASIFGVTAEIGGTKGGKKSKTQKTTNFQCNLSDISNVIAILKEFSEKRYIVLDDFHYLSLSVQRTFASAIKSVFEDSDYTFVVVGVWREENRLIKLNGDLEGRVIDIPVGHWTREDLNKVISKGEPLLNIRIDKDFKDYVVESCFGGVYIVQEACKKLCLKYKVRETQESIKRIGNIEDAKLIVCEISDEISPRYGNFVAEFLNLKNKAIDSVSIEDYLSIITSIMTAPFHVLSNGVTLGEIMKVKRRRFKPKVDFEKNMRNALIELAHCQMELGYDPIVLSYDMVTARLSIVDRGFLFWLTMVDREALLVGHSYHRSR
jgi:hypothetical protein